MSGIVLAGVKYSWYPLEQIEIRDQIRVEHWLWGEGAEFTDARTWDDILAIATEVNSLASFEEQKAHPDFKLALAIMVWACKRGAGEQVALGDELGRWTWDDLHFWSDETEGKDPAAQ